MYIYNLKAAIMETRHTHLYINMLQYSYTIHFTWSLINIKCHKMIMIKYIINIMLLYQQFGLRLCLQTGFLRSSNWLSAYESLPHESGGERK